MKLRPQKRHDAQIGRRLRAERVEQRLSLRALAKQSGFSASFLSQLELGQVSPSLESLDRIATCLGLTLAGLLSRPEDTSGPQLRRKGEPALRSEWSQATAQSLLPSGSDGGVDVVLVTLEPGGHTGHNTRSSAGRELGFCVRGRATVSIGGASQELKSGDSIFYDTSQPVVWQNQTSRPSEILLVTIRQAMLTRRAHAL